MASLISLNLLLFHLLIVASPLIVLCSSAAAYNGQSPKVEKKPIMKASTPQIEIEDDQIGDSASMVFAPPYGLPSLPQFPPFPFIPATPLFDSPPTPPSQLVQEETP
ncbi:hypothetical protein CCACVL1_11504 [Corchorus capsularis]|uniref:Hydroxyproline-rich glycoprotein family protein n=1 Tax=Corchorus capsularis TaxID=210143 RepID=A0A1R3IKY9_COCAP|nr:hypothetical protein CCACVL1_11504 [Corchorus capsularis]